MSLRASEAWLNRNRVVPLRAPKEVVRADSEIEAMFALQLRADKFPTPKRNYVFLPDRKLELDFCWPELKLGVEVEGEVHRIKERFHKDIEKHALALLQGWTVMRVDGRAIRSGSAIAWFQELWPSVQNRTQVVVSPAPARE